LSGRNFIRNTSLGTVTNEIGFALWDFIGDFGNFTDVEYQDWYGYKLDKKCWSFMQKQ